MIHRFCCRRYLVALLSAAACVAVLTRMEAAEKRVFVSATGQTLEASLLSHKAGKVTLERADGKRFEVVPSAFGVEDQLFLKEWMKSTPEKMTYLFGVVAAKEKVDGGFTDMGYKRIKNERWSYKIEVTNRSSDTMKGLTVLYRLFHTNYADGEFSAGSTLAPALMTEGKETLAEELPYNKSSEFRTVPVQLDFVDYDGSGYRYKDELQGIILRIVDAHGQVVHEWSNQASPMKGRTWDNTGDTPRPEGGPGMIR